MTTGLERRTVLDDLLVRLRVFFVGVVTRPLDVLFCVQRPRLLATYLTLWVLRYRSSPYHWPRRYDAVFALKRAGQAQRTVAYGETPLATSVRLFRRWGLDHTGTLLDPCAGRGRVLLAGRFLGATTRGVEINPEHVELTADVLAHAGAKLVVGDGADPKHYEGVTHAFVCWTAFPPPLRQRFIEALAALPAGALAFCLSHPAEAAFLELLDDHLLLANWGPERVYVYRRR